MSSCTGLSTSKKREDSKEHVKMLRKRLREDVWECVRRFVGDKRSPQYLAGGGREERAGRRGA